MIDKKPVQERSGKNSIYPQVKSVKMISPYRSQKRDDFVGEPAGSLGFTDSGEASMTNGAREEHAKQEQSYIIYTRSHRFRLK